MQTRALIKGVADAGLLSSDNDVFALGWHDSYHRL